MKKPYRVMVACEVAGRWRAAGARIEMTDAEAKYLAPPLGSVLIPVKEGRQDHGKLNGRERKRRNHAGRLGARSAVDHDHPDDAAR